MPEFDANKRALFRRFSPKVQDINSVLRPPYALDEVKFLHHCSQCNACVKACPNNQIVLQMGYPERLSTEQCDDCYACLLACTSGALSREKLFPVFNHNCSPSLAFYCQSCAEVCPQNALKIEKGNKPSLEATLCNGCAECVSQCEFNAIALNSK